MSTLVIVESPAKAKTISKFLEKDYIVKSSFGHVRDLPKSKMGIDIAHNFEPQYIIDRKKSKVIKELKAAAEKIDNVLFATDEDREGEAISWHLAHILDIEPTKAQRIVFHEITKHAIMEALENPRLLDLKLVDAQQARRVLDRLVGYELSPFLWRKVARGLSAGRVQSVAVRLTVEREREIKTFKPEEYWSLAGIFAKPNATDQITSKLHAVNGKKLDKLDIKTKTAMDEIVNKLNGASYAVKNIENKNTKRYPSPPFTTSTLQQEANSRLGFSAKQTMRLAQQLYEGVDLSDEGSVGLITYMRTDSVNLASKFLNEAAELVTKDYGAKYGLEKPRAYTNKSKNAQEAHEAIRPTEIFRTPEMVEKFLDRNHARLYDLIWRRALATQMAAAELNNAIIDIESNNNYLFRATGQTIIFDGFLKLYPDKTKENILPTVTLNDAVNCLSLKPEQHFTEPPARYSDATLVKALEEYGIGRPSTYAPTIATIEDRGYVERDEKKRLAPLPIAFTVIDMLTKHFPAIVDYQFTAQMEDTLDDIARGAKKWQPVISDFYFPFKENLKNKETEVERIKTMDEPTNEKCDKCGAPMVIKTGRFGKFMACSAFPDCKNIKNIEKKTGVKCPQCQQGEITEKRSKRGKIFFSCNRYPQCDFALWDRPTGEKCPHCESLLVTTARKVTKCSNKECKYKTESPT